MTVQVWLSFVGASLVLGFIPGPSVCFTIAQGIKKGSARTVPSILGQLAANILQLLIICVGLSGLLERSAGLLAAIKLAGAAYLVYIGVKLWFAPRPDLDAARGSGPNGAFRGFVDGFIVCGTNPKALLYYAAFLPQFMIPHIDQNLQLLILGATSLAVAAFILTFYALLAGRVRYWLLERGCWRVQNRFSSVLMIGAGAALNLAGDK